MHETVNQLLRIYEEMEHRLEQNRDKITALEQRLYSDVLYWRRKQCTKMAEALRETDDEVKKRLMVTSIRFGIVATNYENQLQEIIDEIRDRNK